MTHSLSALPAAVDGATSRAPAVTRAVALLHLLAASGSIPMGISDLARKLDIPKSSALNLCSALVETGLVRRRSGGFVLGSGLLELGARYLGSVDLASEFQVAANEYEELSGEMCQLALLGSGLDVIYVARQLGERPLRLASEIGGHLPANCTATGMSMLALLRPKELASRLPASGQLETMTQRSISTVEELHNRLEQTRSLGYGIDDEETVTGTVCVAAAFRPSPATGIKGPAAISVTINKAEATPSGWPRSPARPRSSPTGWASRSAPS
ncbi:IclR family transcriptional regulator [Phytohabitans flavus]|uniref:IclR family transcriptional regulator n=1 Tax=Phytohabitans flavus TaxID=1076124 RepID=A0A6F8XWB7_9ACTN|nr:IclR family transcriptional regulator [Phytohabitans flavus]BCB78152.1 IclR family transcriptional regulator [Phytohabitans flavus]